jgi:putative membrane protein
MIGYLLIAIVLVAAVVWLVGGEFARGPGPAKSALDILKERYARGEIGKEEFERKRRDLQQ